MEHPKCNDAIAARGGAAIIPPRNHAKPWKPDTPGPLVSFCGPMAANTPTRSDILRTSKRVCRTTGRRWRCDLCRSRAETKMRRIKLLGPRPSERDFLRRAEEFQICAAVLNSFVALGIPVTEAVQQVCPGRGTVWPSADFCIRAGLYLRS